MSRRAAWRNRIVDKGTQPASQFVGHPDNFRVHTGEQEEALTAILERVGWVRDVLVSKRSGYVVDGHLRVQAALRKGEETPVPYATIDVTENEEALLLAALDPLAAMARTDREKLGELLQLVPEDLSDIVRIVHAERKALRKLVEFEATEVHRVVVECETARDQEALIGRLRGEGYTCRVG